MTPRTHRSPLTRLAAPALAALLLLACTSDDPPPTATATAAIASLEVPPTPTSTSPTPTSESTATTEPTSTPAPDPALPRSVEIGDVLPLPADLALIVETGCAECDGSAETLERIYRDNPSGDLRLDTIFTFTGAGVRSAQSPRPGELLAVECSTGYCGGVTTTASDDAATTLRRSPDGGMTWESSEPRQGAYYTRGAAGIEDALVTRIPAEDGVQWGSLGYQWLLSDEPVEPPAGLDPGDASPRTLPNGSVVWWTDNGRLLTANGEVILQTAREPLETMVPSPSGQRFAVATRVRQPQTIDFLEIYSREEPTGQAELLTTFVLDAFAPAWIDETHLVISVQLLHVELGPLAHELPPQARELLFLTYVPAVLDIESGELRPIVEPFLDEAHAGERNRVIAVQYGPFARVIAGEGSCTEVRTAPSADSASLDCAADGVLLRRMGTESDGWLSVATPAGIEGWTRADALAFTALPSLPPGELAAGPTITARSGAVVYTAPRTSALALGTLPPDIPIQVLGRSALDPEWLAIEGAGWVALADVALNPLDAELTVIAASDPRAAAPPHPHETRTGVPRIDEIIALVETADIEGLTARVEVSLSRCGDPDEGEDAFWPCPADPSAPTTREYLPIVACGGDRADANQARDYIVALFDPSYRGYQGDSSGTVAPLFVYAVTEPRDGGFTVAFVYGAGSVIRWINIDSGNHIRMIGYGCDDHPAGEMIWPDSAYLLGPRVPPPLLPLSDHGNATTQ